MIQDPKKLKQIKITEYFSSRRMTEDSRNHVVPFYATFSDYEFPDIQFMVMPVLRRFDDPEFIFACEVIDFVSQVLEVRFYSFMRFLLRLHLKLTIIKGLEFLHSNNVSHQCVDPFYNPLTHV